ncbi:hypothetical protein FRC16_000697 [Serendipita sp. 398]|nr:hypothetical protein FRC16_000697 [Serendipita sp. 398]KAG8833679.1 hypothetical protein FRC18_003234 [Serendipita sp. 400]
MAWNSPNTVVPNLPYGVSPANIPVPLTPIMPGGGQLLPGHQMVGGGGGYIVQPQAPQQMFMGQPNVYGHQQYLTTGRGQPQFMQQPQQIYGGGPQFMVPGMYGAGHAAKFKLREDNPPLDKWINGKDYGPVLDTMTATILGIQLQVNPILRHHSEQTDEGGRLTWDILEAAKDAEITEGTESKTWTGREAAATFPRMDRLYLVSHHAPSVIEVVGSGVGGCVTCWDVVVSIQAFVKEKVSRSVYEKLSLVKKAKIDATYHFNRGGKGGATGRDLGQGIRKGDLIEEWSTFDGLDDDPDEVRKALGIGKIAESKAGRRRSVHIADDADSGVKRTKQRAWVGHLVLRLEHREGEDVPFVPPEEPKVESPKTEDLDGDSNEDDSEEEAPNAAYYVDHRAAMKQAMKQARREAKQSQGRGNIHYGVPGVHMQPQGYPQMHPQMVYSGGAPVVYAAPQNQGYVITPQGTPQVMPGYIPAQTPAMTQYLLSPQQFPGQPPPLGTPLPRGRPFQ